MAMVNNDDTCCFGDICKLHEKSCWCFKHKKQCAVRRAEILVAGTSCKDLSMANGSRGKIGSGGSVMSQQTTPGGSAHTFYGLVAYPDVFAIICGCREQRRIAGWESSRPGHNVCRAPVSWVDVMKMVIVRTSPTQTMFSFVGVTTGAQRFAQCVNFTNKCFEAEFVWHHKPDQESDDCLFELCVCRGYLTKMASCKSRARPKLHWNYWSTTQIGKCLI